MTDLKGKTAVVTGSTSGIGLAIARKMAGAGANVVINGFGEAAAIEKERAGIESDFKVKDGHVEVPRGPGLGITIDEAALKKNTLLYDKVG